jgi:hypothetical protein
VEVLPVWRAPVSTTTGRVRTDRCRPGSMSLGREPGGRPAQNAFFRKLAGRTYLAGERDGSREKYLSQNDVSQSKCSGDRDGALRASFSSRISRARKMPCPPRSAR